MSKRENRDTYLPESKVVTRIVDTSDKISQFLAELQQQLPDERSQLHMDNLIGLQDKLTEKIADYRDKAPWQVTDTYVQYVDAGSGKVEDMMKEQGSVTSINDATAVALALNEEMARELEHVSINEGVQESREAFENLQFLIRETCRKISMDRSMAGDL